MVDLVKRIRVSLADWLMRASDRVRPAKLARGYEFLNAPQPLNTDAVERWLDSVSLGRPGVRK